MRVTGRGGREIAVVATAESLARGTQLATLFSRTGKSVVLVLPPGVRAPADVAHTLVVDEGDTAVTPAYLGWSYAVYRALRDRSPEAVVFPLGGGHGYCAARARQTGTGLERTTVVIDCDEPMLRTIERDRRPYLSKRALGVAAAERLSLGLADAHVCEDEHLQRWLARWSLPERVSPQDIPAAIARDGADAELPAVTVVIAFHERTRYLSDCLEGFAAQTYPALELLLVDDGSRSDAARAELRRHEERDWPWPLRVLRVEHRGLAATRDRGWRAATHEHVLFFDDDDVPFPQLVETLVRARAHSGADVVVAGARFFDGTAPPVARPEDVVRISLCEPGELGLISNQYGGPVNLWPRELLQRLGGIRDVVTEDWDTLARATYAGARITTAPDPLYWYRQTPGSMYTADPAAFRDAGIPDLAAAAAAQLPQEWGLLPHLAAGAYSELERRKRARSRWQAALARGRSLTARAVTIVRNG